MPLLSGNFKEVSSGTSSFKRNNESQIGTTSLKWNNESWVEQPLTHTGQKAPIYYLFNGKVSYF